MNINAALRNTTHLFLDTAPVIYYVEQNPHYFARVQPVFDAIDAGSLTAVTSPITLAEALIVPSRLGLLQLQQDFFDLIVYGHNTLFVVIEHDCARRAAELRARYNLTLTDALQIAVALTTDCQVFLTNDTGLRRVTELRILVLDELGL